MPDLTPDGPLPRAAGVPYLTCVATIGHLALGIAAGRVHARERSDRIGHCLLFGLLAALPDADLLAILVGHPHAVPHRGPTHSLAFAAVTGVLVAIALPGRWVVGSSRVRTGVLAFLAVVSHPLVDPLIAGSGGTGLLWPFSHTRFTWGHFQPIPEAFTGFSWPFVSPAALGVEALLFSPFLLYALPLRRRATRRRERYDARRITISEAACTIEPDAGVAAESP